MFESFDAAVPPTDKGRLRVSLLGSSVVYLGLGAALVAASAAARRVSHDEDLVQIVIAAPPDAPPVEPPAAPARATVVGAARPKVKRRPLEAPKEVPAERPAESEAALAPAPAVEEGQAGFLDGVVGGTGTVAGAGLPPPAPPTTERPKQLAPTAPVPKAGNRLPVYPRVARQEGIQGQVVARVLIRADGTVAKVQILSGPEIFHESVTEALMSYRYEPARLPNGKAVAVYHAVTLPFTLTDAG